MAHTFQREALYEEVWSTPLSTLGPKYGLSDNGLRKICKAMSIPLPQAGHWAKVAAGKPVRKIPLPAKADRTWFYSEPPPPTAPEHVDLDDQSWLKERLEFEARPEQRIVVPEEPELWHSAIAPLKEALQESIRKRARDFEERDSAAAKREKLAMLGRWEPDMDYIEYRHLESAVLRHPRFDGCLQVSEATGTRALCLINALFLAWEARGYEAGFGKNRSRFRLSLPRATFHLLLRERQSGELAFNVSRDVLPEFVVTGTADDRLEDQLNRFLCRLYRSVVSSREKAKQWEAEKEQGRLRAIAAEARRQQLAAEAAARAAEQARREALAVEVSNWEQARRIRDYVRAIEAAPLTAQAAQDERSSWRAWALEVADGICPLPSRLKSFDPEQ